MKTNKTISPLLMMFTSSCLALPIMLADTPNPSDEDAIVAVDTPKPKPPGKRRGVKGGKQRLGGGLGKPRIEDTIKANVYADNWFVLYVNGEMVAVDSIKFIPHNVISVDLLPKYPMTIAVMAKDNADPQTAMEYKNTNIGDGGFILKFSDGTVTDSSWKAKNFFHGPIGGEVKNPRVSRIPIPKDWHTVAFDDSSWANAKEFAEEQVGPKQPFYDADFKGAKFIWTADLELDNTIIFRRRVDRPPNGSEPKVFPILNE